MRRPLCLCLLVAFAAPASSSPKLTVRLAGLTLPEALSRLQAFYGFRMTAPDAPSGARGSFDWRDASLGQVTRDVARQFRVQPTTAPDGSIRFSAANPVLAGPTVTAAGVALTLTEVSVLETQTQLTAGAAAEARRRVRLSFTARDEAGEPRRPLEIADVRALDDQGRTLKVISPDHPPANGARGYPDERTFKIDLALPDAPARRLARVEGTLVASRLVTTHRVEIPLRVGRDAAPKQAGDVGITLREAGSPETALELRLDWPLSRELSLRANVSDSDLIVFARGPDGALAPAPIRSITLDDSAGVHTAVARLGPLAADAAAALVCDITERSPELVRAPFRFTNIPLPQSRSSQPADPTKGGLMLTVRGASAHADISIGLARRSGKTWGPVRWSTHTFDRGNAVTLERLEPGSYRVVATQEATGSGAGPKQRFQADNSVTVSAGAVRRLALVRAPAARP